jgi:propionate CoA-transferase
MEMGDRKIIARRAAFDLIPNSVVNLGIGMPEGVSNVANEEKIIEYLTLTAEPGVIGGLPAGRSQFRCRRQYRGSDRSAVPVRFLRRRRAGPGLSRPGPGRRSRQSQCEQVRPKLAGAGGFINISQAAKKVVFVGTFTAGGLKVSVRDRKLTIDQEGKVKNLSNRWSMSPFPVPTPYPKTSPCAMSPSDASFR